MKPGLWAFKRLEPDDGKLSRPVLRGRRRWQHLLCYPTLKVLILLGLSSLMATTATKPNMQKVYDEAKNWNKAKLDQMPDTKTAHATAAIGVCRGASVGEPLMIQPPCPKKQKLNEVVDAAIGDNRTGLEVTSQSFENSKNPHPDILSPSKLKTTEILVFVSFSMPKASLRTLAKEAAKHNAVLVMRGLKGDSFKTTQQAFLEIANETDNPKLDHNEIAKNAPQDIQGFEVNPELFKTYHIKKVPTFVLVKNQAEVARLSGNVSLSFAAKKLKENI